MERQMEDIVRKYIQAGLDKNIETVKAVLADDIIYSESYGPEYRGLNQVLKWFVDINEKGSALEWSIKKMISHDKTVVAEWFFVYQANEGEKTSFDGVTIAEFNDDMKICNWREFTSAPEHYFPYDE